jgi:RimJ/RimL family protein N-acetyltransferase
MAPFSELVDDGDLRLCRWTPDDAERLAALVTENVEHLRPRMAWVAAEPLALAARQALLEGWDQQWRQGREVVYRIELDGVAVGTCGLHDRGGPDEREIGYWVDHRHLGRGLATRSSALLTDVAFEQPAVSSVVILHDVTNLASRRVPEKLGYRNLGERPSDRPLGPADVGRDGVWSMDRVAWLSR